MERCAPLGQPGDGMRRQLDLRLGTKIVTMDLCVVCYERARWLLAESFPNMAKALQPMKVGELPP